MSKKLWDFEKKNVNGNFGFFKCNDLNLFYQIDTTFNLTVKMGHRAYILNNCKEIKNW